MVMASPRREHCCLAHSTARVYNNVFLIIHSFSAGPQFSLSVQSCVFDISFIHFLQAHSSARVYHVLLISHYFWPSLAHNSSSCEGGLIRHVVKAAFLVKLVYEDPSKDQDLAMPLLQLGHPLIEQDLAMLLLQGMR